MLTILANDTFFIFAQMDTKNGIFITCFGRNTEASRPNNSDVIDMSHPNNCVITLQTAYCFLQGKAPFSASRIRLSAGKCSFSGALVRYLLTTFTN